jgi:succinate dehydrogenase / fumarate reductase cytochrome b subunit
MVASFRIWWVAGFYIVAMLALGLHLYHGAWSSMRTLGYAKSSPHPLHRRIALLVAAVVWLGFTIIPVSVITGALR